MAVLALSFVKHEIETQFVVYGPIRGLTPRTAPLQSGDRVGLERSEQMPARK